MTARNTGLLPVAILSLIVGAFAIGVVLLESGRRAPQAEADASYAELRFPISVSSKNERTKPQSARIVIGGLEEKLAVVASAAPDQMKLVPRLKPRRRPEGVPIVSTIDPAAVYLADAAPVAIAPADDFTGGRESLFAAYAQAQAESRAERAYMTVVLNRGENLSQTLLALGAGEIETEAMLTAAGEVTDIKKIESGTAIDYAFEPVRRDNDGGDMTAEGLQSYDLALMRLRFRPDDRHIVTAWRDRDGQYTARIEELQIQKRYAAVAGVINHSLFMAGSRSEVPPEIMQRFANLFLYDIDFARDIFAGDRFEAVYEVLYDEEGEYVGSGDIVFAAMTWRGKTRARNYYRFDEAEGMEIPFFDASGESATRMLMKTPIEGARVTSGFGRRKHPILGYTKAHKGVDFGAPRGTPIMAAGDGKIVRAAPTGTFGNYIKIEHASGFETAYAHLNGFAKGIKAGARVRQGDIIGYVGTTGRSTGPHLHYEVLKSGVVQNPMTLDVANGRVLDGDLLASFEDRRLFVDTLRVHPYTIASATNQ
ncbi:M23 family metallopeptidase [Parvularcula marina]|uniref:M23 family metallopeptidase n=1 Tax=Parvularcula marina TaxID=2292771 RepID=UPI003515221C